MCIDKLSREITKLNFSDLLNIDTELKCDVEFSKVLTIAVNAEDNIWAYIGKSSDKVLLRMLGSFIRFGSLRQSKHFVCFETILGKEAYLTTIRGAVTEITYLSGNTGRQYLTYAPYSTTTQQLVELHKIRLSELTSNGTPDNRLYY